MGDTEPATRELALALIAASVPIHAMLLGSDVDPETIIGVVQDSFTYLIRRHGSAQVTRAARIVEDACDLICAEIHVPVDTLENDELQLEP